MDELSVISSKLSEIIDCVKQKKRLYDNVKTLFNFSVIPLGLILTVLLIDLQLFIKYL